MNTYHTGKVEETESDMVANIAPMIRQEGEVIVNREVYKIKEPKQMSPYIDWFVWPNKQTRYMKKTNSITT